MGPIVTLDADRFATALPELLGIYAAAMHYAPAVANARAPLWLDHSRRSGFRCVIALSPASQHDDGFRDAPGAAQPATASTIAGFSYGYDGAPGQWWFNEVARGLGDGGRDWLAGYFELTELHVRPTHQGRGIGESLLRALLQPVERRTVLLSTPEGDNRAWSLYRRLEFADVLRQFKFAGDSRPFAVLGRSLPLPPRPEQR